MCFGCVSFGVRYLDKFEGILLLRGMVLNGNFYHHWSIYGLIKTVRMVKEHF